MNLGWHRPSVPGPIGARAAGEVAVAFQQGAHQLHVCFGHQWLKIHAGLVAAPGREVAAAIVDVGNAAAHAGGKVAARLAKDDDGPIGHVFASMVATPSTTAVAPELRTAKRSPAIPFRKTSPAVAP